MWHQGSWGWFPPVWMFYLLFFIAISFLFRSRCAGYGMRGRKKDSAREILDRRYAGGEINQEEYLRMRKDLD